VKTLIDKLAAEVREPSDDSPNDPPGDGVAESLDTVSDTLSETVSEKVSMTVSERDCFSTMGGRGRNDVAVNGSPFPSTPLPIPVPAAKPRDATRFRVDVEHICEHLADRIEANGVDRPRISKKWRDAARLLIDKDGKTEAQIHDAIDWSQDDEFWRANILSLPKLREKYSQLQLQAARGRKPPPVGAPTTESTSTQRARAAVEAGREVQAMIDRGELTA
jgi:hypothetical protein